jgi:beta-N-acetylhexosaminidase
MKRLVFCYLSWLSLVTAQDSPLQVGGLMLLAFEGNQAPLERLQEFKPAGFVLYRSNLDSTEQARALTQFLQNAASYPLLFGIDQEGGPFNAYRVDTATLFPSQMALAATRDPELATRVAYAMASELKYMGFNLVFSPVVDVNSNPNNPIIGLRSFSAEVDLVSAFGKAYLQGFEQAGIVAVAKHFPGHGDTSTDSHIQLPVVEANLERLQNLELAPFKSMINAGVPAIMSAHVVFPALDDQPATLSPFILTDLLRDALGFQGLIITDSLAMKAISDNYGAGEAAVQSILAGADLLLLGPDINLQRTVYTALEQALASGQLSEARVREALSHIQNAVSKYPATWQEAPDYNAHQALAAEGASKAVTLLYNDGVLPLKPEDNILVLAPRTMQYGEPPLLGDVLAEHHQHVMSLRISTAPTAEEINLALELSSHADVIVLGSYHWQEGFAPSLVELEAKLIATGKPLVGVALGYPDDLIFFNHRPNAYLASYGFWEADLQAISDILTGQLLPSGKLPVPVGDYPIGSGVDRF